MFIIWDTPSQSRLKEELNPSLENTEYSTYISPTDSSPKDSSRNGQFPERTLTWITFFIYSNLVYRWYIKVAEGNEFQQNWIAGLLNCWTPLEITSWKCSVNFKAPLRNSIRSSFLEALQTVDGKPATLVKRWLL